LLKIDAQGISDRALVDRPESIGVQFEIQDARSRDLATDQVESVPDPDIRWRIPHGQLRELIAADPYAEPPLKPKCEIEQVDSHGRRPRAPIRADYRTKLYALDGAERDRRCGRCYG
jgi:hypothetical protein